MRRRALLSTLAASALPLAAGCAGDDSGPATDESAATDATESETPTSDATPTDSSTEGHASVDITDVTVQRGYVVREVADAIGIAGDDNQYLCTRVSVEGTAVAPDAFTLDTGTDQYTPLEESRAYRFEGDDSPYTLNSASGWLLFELPLESGVAGTADVADMRLSWPSGGIELDGSIAERIVAGPPSLSVSVEKRREETPATPIAIGVTNEGGAATGRQVPARFVGAINRKGPNVTIAPVQRVVADVPAGESRTIEIEDDWAQESSQDDGSGTDDADDNDGGDDGEGGDERTVEYAIHWAGDSTRVTFGKG